MIFFTITTAYLTVSMPDDWIVEMYHLDGHDVVMDSHDAGYAKHRQKILDNVRNDQSGLILRKCQVYKLY